MRKSSAPDRTDELEKTATLSKQPFPDPEKTVGCAQNNILTEKHFFYSSLPRGTERP
jgi:hypothetical protein